jgi:hypothetical protein
MQETQMDAATQREDMNGMSSVANIRQKQEERRRAMAEAALQRQLADDGKRRTKTVAVGLAYSPLFQSYRDQ